MSLVQQLVTALRTAMSTVDQAQVSITTARNHGDEATLLIQQATDGTSDPRPTEAVMRLQQAQEHLDEATVELHAGSRSLDDYITNVLGGGTTSASMHVPAAAGQQAAIAEPSPPIPAAVRRLAEQLPEWMEDDPTRALVYSDEDGADVEITSGRDRSSAKGLLPEYARRWVVTDHAEGHIAARMRQPDAEKRVTVVINKEPCGGVKGCDATMPDIIPQGSAMRIFVNDGELVRHFGTYRGTGKGITP